MKISIIAVGRLKSRAVEELVKEYEKRLPPGVKLEWIEVAAARGKLAAAEIIAQEAGKIRGRLPARAWLVALSERGVEMDSRALADWLAGLRDRGRDLCLIIGGQEGLEPGLTKQADQTIALSRLTFPHELTRAIVAEQLYRAFSILANQPYHR
jgi:23S rRNA (pseudouridine1915-N3)-methyltransferase